MKKYMAVVAVLASTVMAVLVPNAQAQLFMMKNSFEGKAAADFTLLSTAGKEMSLAEARGDQSAILLFWATWCPHCREQLSHLASMSAEFESKGIKVLLVDVGEGPGQVQAFLEKHSIPYPAFLDQDSKISELYEIIGVPTFFFINKTGIVKTVVHAFPEDYEEILK